MTVCALRDGAADEAVELIVGDGLEPLALALDLVANDAPVRRVEEAMGGQDDLPAQQVLRAQWVLHLLCHHAGAGRPFPASLARTAAAHSRTAWLCLSVAMSATVPSGRATAPCPPCTAASTASFTRCACSTSAGDGANPSFSAGTSAASVHSAPRSPWRPRAPDTLGGGAAAADQQHAVGLAAGDTCRHDGPSAGEEERVYVVGGLHARVGQNALFV